ncbi:ectoine/hydroxyectoine ABC transporter ATP-binding protein EhuA [Agrobacterium tumefaciens]|uniref:amino acid ABC transporter ATP-binding protein n=2 Tax=Rhizobium/Agrobacterium group TaxID=227290 RepID=UPI00080F9846|nr:amino acid ABC transporter ATP-binding protein [Agrobacterium tumefaciens]NSY09964.1 amino acid ABC transporter ATP-binding protein [Agrobacterium tumefaciens]NSY93650.1 amino acid ABC transporter ATP-binding protein [Agrobacterium tumefaciens]NSZ09610.1 amino acid ABC transporter ATP-binding protein [Agrobacterium tumefaciens]NSZ25523.1 amino acid ABC transporter ATP-binding protein [Agrobacterium tumefaciens]
MLDIHALYKSFNGVNVLNNINLRVMPGELVFLIGPSGSGKSTLLRCCNRLEEPTDGAIIVDGINITAVATDINNMRQRIGMVFQQFNLYPHMTAEQNVMLALQRVQKKSTNEAREIARRELTRVGLGARLTHYPSQLSGGQQQRVAIARALALGPKVMLLDEPTSALDPQLVAEILQAMMDMKKEGMTMLVVSHEMRFAREAADRVAFMEAGQIVEIGTPAEILARGAESRAFQFLSHGH